MKKKKTTLDGKELYNREYFDQHPSEWLDMPEHKRKAIKKEWAAEDQKEWKAGYKKNPHFSTVEEVDDFIEYGGFNEMDINERTKIVKMRDELLMNQKEEIDIESAIEDKRRIAEGNITDEEWFAKQPTSVKKEIFERVGINLEDPLEEGTIEITGDAETLAKINGLE